SRVQRFTDSRIWRGIRVNRHQPVNNAVVDFRNTVSETHKVNKGRVLSDGRNRMDIKVRLQKEISRKHGGYLTTKGKYGISASEHSDMQGCPGIHVPVTQPPEKGFPFFSCGNVPRQIPAIV